MKKLVMVALLAIGISGFAQDMKPEHKRDNRERLTPEQRIEKRLTKLTKDLDLNTKQQAQVGDLLKEQQEKSNAMMIARKERTSKPTKEEREAMKKQMMAEKDASDVKMKSILDAKQYKKYEAMREEQLQKMKERMNDRRSSGGEEIGE